jgi:hypothetical protein
VTAKWPPTKLCRVCERFVQRSVRVYKRKRLKRPRTLTGKNVSANGHETYELFVLLSNVLGAFEWIVNVRVVQERGGRQWSGRSESGLGGTSGRGQWRAGRTSGRDKGTAAVGRTLAVSTAHLTPTAVVGGFG